MKKSTITILITFLTVFIMSLFAPEKEEVFKVNVVSPKVETIYDYVTANGRIKEANKKNIYADSLASVSEVRVKVGDYVKKGDVLASIETISENENFSDFFTVEDALKSFENTAYETVFAGERGERIIAKEKSIKSPIDGVITSLNISSGDKITTLHKLLTVSDFENLYIEIMVPEEYASQIAVGNKCEITSSAFGIKRYSATISEISPVARYIPSLTGNGKTYIEVKAYFDKIVKKIIPELSVNTKIAVNTRKDAITIPYECVMQDEENREYVFCIEGKTGVKKKYITTGYELEDKLEVRRGLSREALVVYLPPEKLNESSVVTVGSVKK